jgi:HPt (histidine-containing phosphotransfer) domain-containing protein
MVPTRDANAPVMNSLRSLIIRHRASLAERVGALSALVSSFSDATDPAAQIAECRAFAHHIAGASGSIGFDRLGELAAMLERKLVEVQEGAQPASKAQLGEVALLSAELRRVAGDTKPEHSRLYDIDLGTIVRTGT